MIEDTVNELAASWCADKHDKQATDPNGDCRALQMWLAQLASALRGSCADQKADALAAIDLFTYDCR